MYESQGSSLILPSDASKGRNPAGGKSLYVSNLTADNNSDDHEGTDPQYPLATIAAALALVTTRKHDYIFVQDSYDQESFPLTPAVRDVHIIGLGNGALASNRCLLDGAGEAAISIGTDCDGIEIAGFELGSTGAADPCILVNGLLWKAHIHHCAFGELIAAQDGILCASGQEMNNCLIDNNFFSRSLGRDGVRCWSPSWSFFNNNIFRRYAGIGIYMNGPDSGRLGGILGNVFYKAQGASEGWAITIDNVEFGIIDDNRAPADGASPAANPYLDTSVATPDQLNAWGVNYRGSTVTYPA